MREESDEGRRAENSREGRKIMMRNKRRSGGSDKRLRGINVKSSSKRTRGGGGNRESENKNTKTKKRENVEIISEAVYMDQTRPHHPAVG